MPAPAWRGTGAPPGQAAASGGPARDLAALAFTGVAFAAKLELAEELAGAASRATSWASATATSWNALATPRPPAG